MTELDVKVIKRMIEDSISITEDMLEIAKSRELALVRTKLQEALHWLEEVK